MKSGEWRVESVGEESFGGMFREWRALPDDEAVAAAAYFFGALDVELFRGHHRVSRAVVERAMERAVEFGKQLRVKS